MKEVDMRTKARHSLSRYVRFKRKLERDTVLVRVSWVVEEYFSDDVADLVTNMAILDSDHWPGPIFNTSDW